MFFVVLRRLILALCCVGLLGCASALKQQSYNREANTAIKRVAVLPMAESKVRLFIFNNVGYNFGLVGLLLTEANRSGKENWLEQTAQETGFNQFSLIKQNLTEAMAERGYELVWPEQLTMDPRKMKTDVHGLRKTYTPRTDVDAQLDLGLGFVGYACAGSGKNQPYRPTAYSAVRMMSADGKDVLFADEVLYHNVMDNRTAVVLEPHPDFVYPDFDDLKAAGATSINGLNIAVEAMATAIAEQF